MKSGKVVVVMVTFIVSLFLLVGVLTAVLVRRQARSRPDPPGPRGSADRPSKRVDQDHRATGEGGLDA